MTVLNSSGGAYDGADYNNIRFVATGSESSQTWAGDKKVYLSATEGTCYAYYPYQSETSDITQLPVSTSGQVDYMYADAQQVDISKKDVTLNMKHALSAIRFSLVQGTYSGTGAITEVSVTSSGVGTSATLNAKNGELSTVNGTGSAISVSQSLTLSNVAQNVDVIVIPTKTEAALTLSVTVDGKVYSTTTSALTVQQGSCHTYTVTINAGELSLSGVKVGDWGYDESGAPTITAAGYTVTFEGDYSKFAFINSVSDGTVTIKAYNVESSSMIRPVTISSGASLEQTTNGNLRTITLSNITANITVTFDGTALTWPEDGVYVVQSDGSVVDRMYASTSCIGVALSNAATGQKLMIEKYENANNTESANVYKTAAQTKGSTYTCYFSWGGYGSTSGTFVSLQVGAGSTSYYGNLSLNGTGLNIDPSTWAASGGALSDFAGKSNSAIIKGITTNGSYSTTNAPMAYLLNAFNDASCSATVNQGYRDWYIPSCGQLGLIWLNKKALDNALPAIGGTAFSAGSYWSSSEYSSGSGWYVSLRDGYVGGTRGKYGNCRVRLVRDLI